MRGIPRYTILLVVGVVALWPVRTAAHEVRPAYLEIRQVGAETYDVMWKLPARGDRRLRLDIRMPDGTQQLDEPTGLIRDNAYIERWRMKVAGGLEGQTIHIDGLAATRIDVLVRVEYSSGATQTVRVLPGRPYFAVEAAPSVLGVAWTYLVLGVEHILLGIDHLLFVLALVLIVAGRRRLVRTVTAFTIAHSITLAAAALGLVSVPVAPVEACIALSIVFVAAEIVRGRQGHAGLTARAPWLVAFVFGLLHGLGFASALTNVGLPQQAIPMALFTFNVGVEVGQLAFIAVILLLRTVWSQLPLVRLSWSWRLAPYAIGSIAVFWVIERTAGWN